LEGGINRASSAMRKKKKQPFGRDKREERTVLQRANAKGGEGCVGRRRAAKKGRNSQLGFAFRKKREDFCPIIQRRRNLHAQGKKITALEKGGRSYIRTPLIESSGEKKRVLPRPREASSRPKKKADPLRKNVSILPAEGEKKLHLPKRRWKGRQTEKKGDFGRRKAVIVRLLRSFSLGGKRVPVPQNEGTD